MTLEEKKTAFEKYINTQVFLPIKADDGVRNVSDTLKTVKVLESANMVIAYLDNIKHAVNADILSVVRDNNKILIRDIEFPTPENPDIKTIVV